jgi:hypothetical protein
MSITMHGPENVKSVQFFFTSSFAKFHVQTSGSTDVFMQVHRDCLMIDSDQIPLNFPLHFPLDNLTFVPIYCCAVVQTLSKLHEQELL